MKKASNGKLDTESVQKDRQKRDAREVFRREVRRAFMAGWRQGIQHGQNPKEAPKEEVGEILQSERDRA